MACERRFVNEYRLLALHGQRTVVSMVGGRGRDEDRLSDLAISRHSVTSTVSRPPFPNLFSTSKFN
jgi:hypothetical protein